MDELLEHDPDLHTGQVGAEAEVRAAAAEADVFVGGAQDVEAERVVEHVFVAVGRDVPDADLVARRHGLAPQHGVPSDVAAEVHDRGRPTHDLLGGRPGQ